MIELTTLKLKELVSNNLLHFTHRESSNKHYFFIFPDMYINVKNCEINYVSNSTDNKNSKSMYAVLSVDRYKALSLKIFLQYINKQLLNELYKQFNDINKENFYDIFYLTDTHMLMKTTFDNNIKSQLERIRIIEVCKIKIKGMWFDIKNNKGGFNMQIVDII